MAFLFYNFSITHWDTTTCADQIFDNSRSRILEVTKHQSWHPGLDITCSSIILCLHMHRYWVQIIYCDASRSYVCLCCSISLSCVFACKGWKKQWFWCFVSKYEIWTWFKQRVCWFFTRKVYLHFLFCTFVIICYRYMYFAKIVLIAIC